MFDANADESLKIFSEQINRKKELLDIKTKPTEVVSVANTSKNTEAVVTVNTENTQSKRVEQNIDDWLDDLIIE